MFIGIKECQGLFSSEGVEATINSASLHNTPQIKISLTVSNNVYFFDVQFSVILALFSSKTPFRR
jgi:hypothetical protein